MKTKPIRIVHIMPQIGVGGAERQLYELITHTDPALVQHEVLYYSDSHDEVMLGRYRSGGVNFSRVPRNTKHPIRFLRELSMAIRKAQPDIVHCWLVSANFWGRLAAIRAGVKHIIVAWRSCYIWKPLGMKICEKLTTNRVHHTANSFACANYIAERLGVSSERFTVIYNGIDLDKYGINADRRQIFSGISIPDRTKIVTMVGRLDAKKNYPMLLRVAQKAKLKGHPVHFLIVGGGHMRDEFIELAVQLDVIDIVHFIGIRIDIPQILAASDIFLFTTNLEGFPNVLLEAMATGMPIISTNFAGADELVQNGITGLIVPCDDSNAAYECLHSYIDNPVLARTIGCAGKHFVSERFSMQTMVEKTYAFYMSVMNK
jgi:glycosyltransferase involved in cell wall biosynthesis